MNRLHSAGCTGDQAASLMGNAWKYVRVKNSHVRIHPPTSDVSILPPGPVRYIATIEVLSNQDATWGTGDSKSAGVVSDLFGSML